ncbi:A-kinase anchor protein 200-like isoform X1 [Frieseomelitta varia]|uniref:A-kinase anchor protein 200-like isoform X1 n=1 Tax=Frieseomelitta varia TaxID=561572 RepID=UPI001CB6B39B|nr:A-kinase anchor protein 200-like isoform X1 [Frieseomelitta varia]XP_043512151.1 A-kinase anchor protein 200-like isoform X1 [Frieseomelitta varia]XP_043512152.1 A-kinase anchor protein 200-like isoform X1 [Frieseomelitta varia]
MGARQSRRSVDITTTPKKEGLPAEGGVGDAAAPGDGKLERIEEADTKPTTNGIAPHTDVTEDKDKDKDDATEKDKDKEKQEEVVKAEEAKQESAGESPAETAAEVTTPTEGTPASPNTATSPENKETKKKEKMKKKWSFRSISFSKKDKNKPAREEAPKNGDVTKEEPLAEGGEEAENGSATAGSPLEEKSAVSSPTAENEAALVAAAPTPSTETKEESAASATSSPAEDKTEEPTPSAPTPVPVEEKKEEVEKVEAEKKVVEVSPAGGQFVPDPVEVSVFRVQTVATPSSIIERKTSEDIPSLPPSSPPPTPIDSSPLQQAQQAAATATALAEAFKLPAEAADKDLITPSTLSSLCPERNDPSTPAAESLDATSIQRPPSSSSFVDEQQQQQQPPRTESTLVPPSVEALPVIDTDASNLADEATKNFESLNAGDGDNAATDNTAEVDALPPLESDANSLSGVPVDRLESPSSESSVNRKLVTEETPLSEESNEVEGSTRELGGADENVERSCDASLPEKMQVVEQPLLLSNEIGDLEGARSIENETSEVVVVENVTQEDFVACEREKVPESANTKERDEESVEEVVGSDQILREEIEQAEEAAVIDPPVLTVDAIVESEEGPVPISEEIVVEAKPAVVIPEDEEETETVEEVTNADACISRIDAETIPAIPDVVEDKLETETEHDVVVPTEEIFISEVSEKSEDSFVSNEAMIDPVPPVIDLAIENVANKAADVPEMTRNEEESMPPPLPESPMPLTPQEKFYSESVIIADDSNAVPSPVVHVEPQILDVKDTQEVDGSPFSLPPQHIEETSECFIADIPVPQVDNEASLKISDSPTCPVNEKAMYLPSETQTNSSSSRHSSLMDDLPPAPDDTIQQSDSFKYPLPPEELSCSFSMSEANSELPIPDENASSLRNPTETLPIPPPRSPSPLSNVSITSGLTTSTKDSSQTLLYDDQSNREFKMESVSISLNSYNESDIELKERLAESLAETEKQEESSVSCQLSNNATSSATIQEIHQSTPEPEVPVENNLARDSTTESSADAIKVTTPAVPSEIPASPPSAPAITEDVASVAKAIEEIDISDKAVAAATIECNTNEIIAEAHYQNNINE